MTESEEELDTKLGKRFLVITIDDETKELEVEDSGFATWELVGIADWLWEVAHTEEEEADE